MVVVAARVRSTRAGTAPGSSYNDDMERARRSDELSPRHSAAQVGPRAVVVVLLTMCSAVLSAAGLDELERVVHDACECAAVQPSGMDAAVRCTGGPREFGRVKVRHRDGWDDAQRGRTAMLERVIETCISGAMDADAARARLGLPPSLSDQPRPLVRWRQVAASDLGGHRARLVRIERAPGVSLKGMVEAVADGAVLLRRARRDGGGAERIPLDTIRGAWVMELPQ